MNYAIYYKGECLYSELRLIDAKDMKDHYGCKEWEIIEIAWENRELEGINEDNTRTTRQNKRTRATGRRER